MVSLRSFKIFSGFPVSVEKGLGLLVITKARGHTNEAFSIPSGTIFRTGVLEFVTSQNYELSESSRMVEVGVIAQTGGIAGNVPANQVWTTDIANIIANNPNAFSNGADAVSFSAQMTDKLNIPPDELIQSQLDASTNKIKDMLARDTLPDFPEVDRAVYILGLFFLNNRDTQEKVSSIDTDQFKEQKTSYYRERARQAIFREVLNLISKYRDVSKFMPAPPGTIQTEESESIQDFLRSSKF